MKFTVRDGFVVHAQSIRDLSDGTKQLVERSFYPGDEIDFTAEEAEPHKHKLVPLDKEATKYLNQAVSQPVEAAVPIDQVKELIDKAVAQALAAQQAALVQANPPA
ncbi:hypothetical protein [Parvibium lacunae]|uniref:Uncharacterized protein n=1 Tax=Parvibium lacunae TaxID=1888893 RepID=A0A368L842_9BURK|nr:hypothetical protein [Parvibium lacunae]RCS59722.1 hypothetical protein DU000_03165 [Parvibium lacunae]